MKTPQLPSRMTVVSRSGQQYQAIHWADGEYRIYGGRAYYGSAQWHEEGGLLDRFKEGSQVDEAEWQSVCDAVEASIERSHNGVDA